MPRNSYWKKIASPKILIDIAFGAAEKDDFIKAALAVVPLVDGFVRAEIGCRVPQDDRHKKYYSDPETRFPTLVDTLELLGMDEETIQTLREFSKLRNKVIHSMQNYQTLKELEEVCTELFHLGQKTIDAIGRQPNKSVLANVISIKNGQTK